ARGADAVDDVADALEVVRVGVDRDAHAAARGGGEPSLVEVEAVRVRVELDRGAVRGARVENALDVEGVALAPEQEASARVAEDVDPGVADGAHEALGHLGRRLAEGRVDAADADVVARADLVGVV